MTTAPASTDSSLIFRVQRHEPDAWNALVDLYGPWLFNWSRRLGLSPDDGADVTQETLLAVHRSIAQFRGSAPGSTFRGWLWTILRNKLLDHQRRQTLRGQASGGSTAQRRLIQIPDQAPDPARDPGARTERTALLARALEQVRGEFETRTWQAFWMVVVEGRAPADVAAELGISPAAVRQAKSRILRRLREQLGETGEPNS